MNVGQFIDRLEEQGLLDANVVASLRRRVAKFGGKKKLTPDIIAKYLVDKGHLTRFQATKLISDSKATAPGDGNARGTGGAEPQDNELRLVGEAGSVSPGEVPLHGTDSDEKRDRERQAAEVDELTAIDDDSSTAVASDHVAQTKPPEPSAPKPSQPATPVPPSPAPSPPPGPTPSKGGSWSVRPDPLPDEAPLDELAADLESTSPVLPGQQQKKSGLLGMFGLGDTGGRRPVAERRPTGDGAPLAQRKERPGNPWDSKLLFVGGASLGTMILIGVFLYLSLTRGSADEMFAAAEQDYRDGSYTQAIKRYDRYLKSYPDDRNASLGQVRRQMAHLRQVCANPRQGLEMAKTILPRIEAEESFAEAREGLAGILPEIAESLVAEAKEATDTQRQQELLALTEEAMILVNNPMYIPTSLRKSQLARIDAIQDDMARVQREIERETSLLAAIEAISTAVQGGNTQAAYNVRHELLGKYPGLDTDERLLQAVIGITQKQRDLVRTGTEPLPLSKSDHEMKGQATVVLTHRSGQSTAADPANVVWAMAEGSVFVLDAASGDLLWRRAVGLETTCQPIPVATAGKGPDLLIVDTSRNELVRVMGRTGQLVWRLAVGEPFCDPVVNDQQLFLALQSGKLIVVDLPTGQAARHVVLPQAMDVGPAVSDAASHIYQLGEHDNLYVLSSETLECEEVFYVGHQPGTVAVSPVLAMGCLLIVENAGPDHSMLHVIRTDEDGLNLKPAQKPIRLRGRVVVPPIQKQRRMLVVTDSRAVELYDIEPDPSVSEPVKIVASLSATAEDPMISYPLLSDGYLWIANDRLTKYQVQASTGKLPRVWVKDDRYVYVAPLQMVDNTVIQVYSRRDEPGVVVAATPVGQAEPVWKTELAGRVLQLMVHAEKIQAMTANGRLYEVLAKDISRGFVTQAKASATSDPREILALAEAIDLGDGRWAFSKQKAFDQIVLYDPNQDGGSLKQLSLSGLSAQAMTPPVSFAGGLLVAQQDGQVALIGLAKGLANGPAQGNEEVHAFHPEIRVGQAQQWCRPAVLSDEQRFVISDQRRGLFTVHIRQDPEKHLALIDHVNTDDELSGPLAVLGDLVFGVSRSQDEDQVVGFALPDRTPAGVWPLGGRVLQGPQPVGDAIVVVTDLEFVCLDGKTQVRWRTPSDGATLVGKPLVEGPHWIFATDAGNLSRIDAATGKQITRVQLGEPLATGPVAYGEQWLVASKSGTLIVVDEL